MIEQIKKILSSEFEIELFEAAIYNLNDKKISYDIIILPTALENYQDIF